MIKVSRGCCGLEELDQVKEAFEYGYFGLAYKVEEFETEIAKYLDTDRNVVATNTGTSALHLALKTIGVKSGDEVILPSFTFVATAQIVTECGATPVFCDIDSETFLMDVEDVRRKITSKTKVIIPVHYAGHPCNMDALLKIKAETGIRIVEDAAHAFGSFYRDKKIGSFGDITCFSFDSIKVMTCGDGGAIVSDDPVFADLAKQKRLLGIDRKTMHVKDWKKRSWIYDVPSQGYRYHLSNINAAIGLAQIKKVDAFIARRREICHLYDSLLKGVGGVECMSADYDKVTPFMYVVRVKNGKRNELKTYLMENDIESGISYIPCHRFTTFKTFAVILPVTDKIFEEILCLPIHCGLSDDDVRIVAKTVKEFLAK